MPREVVKCRVCGDYMMMSLLCRVGGCTAGPFAACDDDEHGLQAERDRIDHEVAAHSPRAAPAKKETPR